MYKRQTYDGTTNGVEIGTGCSIMGYPGLATGVCSSDSEDFCRSRNNDNLFFNATSINEMKIFIEANSNDIKKIEVTTDYPPLSSYSKSGSRSWNIPISTPFVLDGTLTDSDGNIVDDSNLIYSWDQADQIQSAAEFPSSTNTSGPLFKSLFPTTSPLRYFPNIETVFEGKTSNDSEFVPSVARTMKFTLAARYSDYNLGPDGAVLHKRIKVNTKSNTTPFKVLSVGNDDGSLNMETAYTVTWQGTDTENSSAIGSQTLKFELIHVNDYTRIELETGVENDGEHTITIPENMDLVGDVYRLIISAENSVFFNVSEPFVISTTTVSEEQAGVTTVCPSDIQNTSLESAMSQFMTSHLLGDASYPSTAEAAAMFLYDASAADLGFSQAADVILVAGNDEFMDTVSTIGNFNPSDIYTVIEQSSSYEISKLSIDPSELPSDSCATYVKVILVCTTNSEYSFAENILKIPEINLHPEMALLSYMPIIGYTPSTTADHVITSLNNMSARSYKYLSLIHI